MDDLTRVAIVDNEIAAELAVSRLRMEGIHAMWRKTDMASAVWGVGITEGVGGPVEILVLAQGCAALRRVGSPPTRGPGESKGLGGLDD